MLHNITTEMIAEGYWAVKADETATLGYVLINHNYYCALYGERMVEAPTLGAAAEWLAAVIQGGEIDTRYERIGGRWNATNQFLRIERHALAAWADVVRNACEADVQPTRCEDPAVRVERANRRYRQALTSATQTLGGRVLVTHQRRDSGLGAQQIAVLDGAADAIVYVAPDWDREAPEVRPLGPVRTLPPMGSAYPESGDTMHARASAQLDLAREVLEACDEYEAAILDLIYYTRRDRPGVVATHEDGYPWPPPAVEYDARPSAARGTESQRRP